MSRHSIVLFILLATPLTAHAINDNAGTTGYNFLKVGVGARAAALGGAYAGIAGELESVAWNPAGLLGIDQRAASASFSRYLIDTQSGFLSVGFPGARRAWAVSVNYFNYGDMRRTDESGEDLGSFGASDVAAYFTVAQKVWSNRIALGANLKAVYSTIDNFSSDAYLIDVGVLIPGPLKGMKLGASLSNLGGVRSGYTDNFTDSLPVNFRIGLAHQPAHTPLPMLIVADLNTPNDGDPYMAFGVEVRIAKGLYVRPGFSTQPTGQDEDPLGLSAGAGVEMEKYHIDYAFTSYPDLDDVHRISVNGNF